MKGRSSPKATRFDETMAAKVRERILAIIEQFPEAQAVAHGTHLSLEVRKKRFGWFLADHHGDGRVAINYKASAVGRAEIIEQMPDHAHVPKYVGHHGWVGLWLDSSTVKWPLVRTALTEAYRMSAPKTLIAELDS